MNKRAFLTCTENLVLGVIYFCAAKFGLSWAVLNPSASAVWPATGIALAALLWRGISLWPAVFVGAFLANWLTQGTVFTSVAIAGGNTLEAVVGAWLVLRWARGAAAFEQIESILKFIIFAGLVSTAISATVGVTTLALGGFAPWQKFGAIWLTWWLGDVVSDFSVAPILLIFIGKSVPRVSRYTALEFTAALAAVVLVGQFVFGGWLTGPIKTYPLSFLCIPPAVWAAFRFQQSGAASATLVMAFIAVTGTMRGGGPFAVADRHESLLLLQAFLGTISLTAFFLAALVSERHRTEIELKRAKEQLGDYADQLETQVTTRTGELRQTISSLEGFCYSIAHDLRTPLRAVQGLVTGLLEDCVPQNSTSDEYARRITGAVAKMDLLIKDLLDYGRLTHQELPCSQISLEVQVAKIIAQLDDEIKARKATIEISAPLPLVRANAVALEQVLANLLENALKFTPANSPAHIEIGARTTSGTVQISIKDNGIGIAPEHHERIFQVFQRLHAGDIYPGTGIGLAIVKKGVERMGGTISLESAPGRGSTFLIELPKC